MEMSKLPIFCVPATGPDAEKFYAKCHKASYPHGLARFGPNDCVLRASYGQELDEILNFEVRASDVFILSFPKCGSTWLQEMVWLIANNLDWEGAKAQIHVRVPFLGTKKGRPAIPEAGHAMEALLTSEKRRFMKSHLPYELLPYGLHKQSPKLIYIVRNAKDTAVSYFHFSVAAYGYQGSLEEFCQAFVTDNVPYSPYWTHIWSYWNVRNNPNILFLKFEDMKKDLRSVLQQTAQFFNKEYSNDQLKQLEDHLSFESMKNNPAVNMDDKREESIKFFGNQDMPHFMRKGKVGTWKKEMSPEMQQKFDQWIASNRIPGLYDQD